MCNVRVSQLRIWDLDRPPSWIRQTNIVCFGKQQRLESMTRSHFILWATRMWILLGGADVLRANIRNPAYTSDFLFGRKKSCSLIAFKKGSLHGVVSNLNMNPPLKMGGFPLLPVRSPIKGGLAK